MEPNYNAHYKLQQYLPPAVLKPSFYWHCFDMFFYELQQYLPFTVCAAECEAAEEQSDDEIRISQVPERREGKMKVMR